MQFESPQWNITKLAKRIPDLKYLFGIYAMLVLAAMLSAVACARMKALHPAGDPPGVEEYATLETMSNGVPVWSFSNLTYIYGISPDLMPGLLMQEANAHPLRKIRPKKSWEIKYNLAGAESEMTVHSAYNDSQPMLPVHLIDGDTETAWASFEMMAPDARPEWIRVDLPVEGQVASVALICVKNTRYGNYGKSLPKQLDVKTSRDAEHWETVYTNKDVNPNQSIVEIKFKPRVAKQIWVIGNDFPKLTAPGDFDQSRYTFSIGELEVRDSAGANLALISRGSSVTVSSTSYVMLNDRFTQDALWGPLNYDLGNKWLRIGGDNGSFMWHYVEHEKGKLRIDPKADESVTECVRHGVNVILNLDFKGNWIYENPPRKTNWTEARYREINDSYNDGLPAADASPEMYQGYLRYVEYMVEHFKDRVSIFEISNEWNAWFGADHYMKTWFEPTYQIIKRVAPHARIMLGSPAGFDREVILDCLGRQRKAGISGGKLLLDASTVTNMSADFLPAERRTGALAVREGLQAGDVKVSVAGRNSGQSGIVLRYKDVKNFLAAIYSAPDHSLTLHEVVDGQWGSPLASQKAPEFGPKVDFVATAQGPLATFTVSNGSRRVSINHKIRHLNDPGTVGLIQRSGDMSQLFDNFVVTDETDKTLAKDSFDGRDGTVPSGWKYISGGPNPIQRGVGERIDAIGWHPNPAPNAAYFTAVRELQKKCRELGFKGDFFATEIYASSIYPPGPPKTSSETQMAKYLVKSLVGHNGLGMEAGPCHPHFTAYAHPQALCQATWGMQTLHPCRPTMTYYMWRNIATVMDDFHPAEFPVNFSAQEKPLFFTFRRSDGEQMVSAWIDGPEKDGIIETKTDLVLPGIQARRATIIDVMNGTEQDADFAVNGSDTVLRGMRMKDYPVFVRVAL